MSMAKRDMKRCPDDEYRYWLFDPEGDGLMFFRSQAERDAHGQACIDGYLFDGEWPDEVEGVCAGEVTHIAKVLNKLMRPDDCDLDDDGFDEDGEAWPEEVGWRGRYTLEPLEPERDEP